VILKSLVVGAFGTNCYIVGSDATMEGMIIDPGDEASLILRSVKETKLKINLIVITHGHGDHIGAIDQVKRATGAKIAIHPSDAVALGSQYSADLLLKGGDSVDIGDLHFFVIHTPGHSPGGICLYGHNILFCGDTLFNYSIGRTDLGGSTSQLLNSIMTKLMILPDNTVVYPGHGPATTIGEERRGNPFLRYR
jgi:glyoxylase-like metal-dependent hydrolase (beta-lactamase superfamily II)